MPGTLAHDALACTFDSLTPLLGLLRGEDLLDLGLEIGEHFSRHASVFFTEGSDAFVMSVKDFADLLALLGCEIEVANESHCGAVRKPGGIFPGAFRLGAQNQHGQRASDHGAGNQQHCAEAEGA